MSQNQRNGDQDDGDRRTARLDEALRLLAEEARQRVARHPSGRLAAFEGENVELTLRLPMGSRGPARELSAAVADDLDLAVAALVTHRAAFRPGAVYCLRCQAADCEHAEPGGPREVFAGWGKTGLPRFVDYPQLLLERGDPRVDRLYDGRPALLAHTVHAGDLTAELIDAYRENPAGYRLHGQVAAGWWTVPGADGHRHPVAVSFQVVSTKPERVARRYGVNLIGRGPEGEPLENVYDRLGELPWSDALRWAQEAVDSVGRTAQGGGRNKGKAKGKGKAKKGGGQHVERRLHGILDGLARRLEKKRRADDRKTGHGKERHRQGDRPTHMALADLAKAGDEDVLVDRRQETLVVLGDKGRAHVFNPAGKLVTSIRYGPEAIERRKKKDVWRPASAAEVAALKGSVEGA